MLTSLALVAPIARAEPPSPSLRWVSAVQPKAEEATTEDDDPLPPPLDLTFAVTEIELPPHVGGDLAKPPPESY